jgi:hypothetical protein
VADALNALPPGGYGQDPPEVLNTLPPARSAEHKVAANEMLQFLLNMPLVGDAFVYCVELVRRQKGYLGEIVGCLSGGLVLD